MDIFAHDDYGYITNRTWIGLNDVSSSDNWEWSDGTAFDFGNNYLGIVLVKDRRRGIPANQIGQSSDVYVCYGDGVLYAQGVTGMISLVDIDMVPCCWTNRFHIYIYSCTFIYKQR